MLFYKIFPDPNREVPIIEDNILFKINHADDKMRTMSNRGVNDSTFTNYTFEEFQAFSPNIRNNIWADPMFISVDHTNNWDLSGTVNLGVQPGSPAAGYGSTLTGGVTPPPPPTDRTGEEGIIRMNLSDS